MDDMDDIDKSDPPIAPILENENKDVKSKDVTEVVSVVGNMTIARAPDPTFIGVKKSKTLSVRLCKSD